MIPFFCVWEDLDRRWRLYIFMVNKKESEIESTRTHFQITTQTKYLNQ